MKELFDEVTMYTYGSEVAAIYDDDLTINNLCSHFIS